MTDWTVSVSRDIAADATTLYELVTDVSRMGEWSPTNRTNIEATLAALAAATES